MFTFLIKQCISLMYTTQDCEKFHGHKIVLSCQPFGETGCLFGELAVQDQVGSYGRLRIKNPSGQHGVTFSISSCKQLGRNKSSASHKLSIYASHWNVPIKAHSSTGCYLQCFCGGSFVIENITLVDVYRAKGNKEWNGIGRTHNLVTKIYVASK